MREAIDFVKYITELSKEKRIALYSGLIILFLGGGVYGLVKFIEGSITRTQKECLDNNIRLTNKCDNLENKLEIANDEIKEEKEYHIKYVEAEIKELTELKNKTNNLKKRLNEND